MEYVHLMELLCSHRESNAFPNMTEMEIIASKDSEPDIAVWKLFFFFFHLKDLAYLLVSVAK